MKVFCLTMTNSKVLTWLVSCTVTMDSSAFKKKKKKSQIIT